MAKGGRYARFEGVEQNLRDVLALDRTVLANERTLLAYLRSGMALVIAGFTFREIFPEGVLAVVGAIAVPLGVIIAAVGVFRWHRMARSIARVLARDSLAKPPKPR